MKKKLFTCVVNKLVDLHGGNINSQHVLFYHYISIVLFSFCLTLLTYMLDALSKNMKNARVRALSCANLRII